MVSFCIFGYVGITFGLIISGFTYHELYMSMIFARNGGENCRYSVLGSFFLIRYLCFLRFCTCQGLAFHRFCTLSSVKKIAQ